MLYLVAVSLLWAFSFGLIKVGLTNLDSTGVAVVRLALALLVFLPFLRPKLIPRPAILRFVMIGAVQFGLMYVLYIAAFRHLAAYEVALFSIFTPIYVVLLDGAISRHLNRRAVMAAGLALAGAAVLKWRSDSGSFDLHGFLLMQGSNLCFAGGQLAYRRTRQKWSGGSDTGIFAWLYVGAVIATGIISGFITDWTGFSPSISQWQALLYLGVVASGIGFFGWNLGATKVNAGTLAVFNNLKIPLAVTVAIVVFGESADGLRLTVSLILMIAALYLTEQKPAT